MDGFVLSSENSHKGIKKCLPMNYQIYPLNVLIMVKNLAIILQPIVLTALLIQDRHLISSETR